MLERHWEQLHSRTHNGSIDYTENYAWLKNQGKKHRAPPPPLPKNTDAEHWITKRFVDHAPEAVEDMDHFLTQVRGKDGNSPEFLQECEKWMDHYRHLLTDRTRLKTPRDSNEDTQEQNADLRDDKDLSPAPEKPTPKPRRYGPHIGRRKFTEEHELELVDRLLDSNCASFADCAKLGTQLLHEVGKVYEDLSVEYMYSFVKIYPQLRTLIDRGLNGYVDPWAPKTGKKNVYTFRAHRDMRMTGIATSMGEVLQREEFERPTPISSEIPKPREEYVRINGLHDFTAPKSHAMSDEEGE